MGKDDVAKTRRNLLKILGGAAMLPAHHELRASGQTVKEEAKTCPSCYPSYDTEMSWPVELDDARRKELARFSSRQYFVDRLRNLQPTHRYTPGKTDFKKWQRALRHELRLRLCLGKQIASPLESRILNVEETGDCRVESLLFQSERGVWVPTQFHIPKNFGAPGPVLLNCVGHGAGVTDPLYAYTLDFVKRGFAVLTPQIRDFGDRAFARPDTMSCDRTVKLAMLLGRTVPGLRLWDLIRAIDYLETRREIDPKRIGCGGLSLGGELSMLLAALDDRIKVAFISGFLSTYDGLMFRKNNCICYAIPGIMEICDMSDIAGLIAPRPCVVQSGTRDGAVLLKYATEAFRELTAVYHDLGADDKVTQDVFEGTHEFHGEKTFQAFERWL